MRTCDRAARSGATSGASAMTTPSRSTCHESDRLSDETKSWWLCSVSEPSVGHLAHRRVRRPVGEKQAVDAELAVVGRVAKVAAIGPALAAVWELLHEALVDQVPDEAALHPRLALEELKVLDDPSVGVAHRVRVLAQDERPHVRRGEQPEAVLRPRVHWREHVGGHVHAVAEAF
eukprot:6181574-Pleurochrysis_carterae.AAC.2